MPIDFSDRMKYIGASEAATVLGLCRWATPLEIWAYKTGELVPDESKNELAKWWGTELEDAVAKRFCKETGKKVQRVTEAYTHKGHDFIRAHIDRKVVGEKSVLQCKTATAFKAKEWEGDEEIPAEYIIQEVVELACSGYDKAYIAVAIGNHDFKIKEMQRDKALEKDVISKLVSFWNNFVVPKVMPSVIRATDDDILYRLYPKAIPDAEIRLSDEYNRDIENLEALSRDKKYLEAQINQIRNKLKAEIKENECGNTGLYKIFWKNCYRKAFEVKEQKFRQLSYKKITEG